MPVYQLDERVLFPDPREANESGVIAVGGDLSVERLVLAYQMGIFPWFSEGMPIIWHCPEERMVIPLAEAHVGKKIRQLVRNHQWRITMDQSFSQVIGACSKVPRDDQDGTWITGDMHHAYCALHERGFAHSVEVWELDKLVGGLYGVSLGSYFFGESMFSKASGSSKVAFTYLLAQLRKWNFSFVDCQVYTEHLARFGGVEVSRENFLAGLQQNLHDTTRQGPWQFDDDVVENPLGFI